MPDMLPAHLPKRPFWETLATFLAIASLWPAYILNWEGRAWKWVCYVMLAIMIVVAIRRLRAFRRG